jgi:hypothetical protein
MRQSARKEQRSINSEIVNNHPWYNDLINKVVMTGGIRRKRTFYLFLNNENIASFYELLLIERIRGIIEDGLEFDQNTFVKILKVLPSHEFNRDEAQRIIRFLKHRISLTERDYVDAVELSGHQIS